MANDYLVARDHPESESNYDEHLARFDELVREGDLAKLKHKIQAAIDDFIEWGQFEVWWQNTRRTHTLEVTGGQMTFNHTDDGLRELLANYRHCRSSSERVRRAWVLLFYLFTEDREQDRHHL